MRIDRIELCQDDIPSKWYNILPDLPETLPAYNDAESGRGIKCLPKIYTKIASKLEFSNQRWINIPDSVLNTYVHLGRPCPLIRARRLEDFLKTPSRIYYKCENLPPVGTFKINTAIPQAYWAMNEGYRRTVFSGSSTKTKFVHVFAAKLFGLTPTLFMTRADCEKNSDSVFFLRKMLEADLIMSPSNRTETGRKILNENPNHPGSMEISYEEVAEEISQSIDSVTVASSQLNHVLMTQTIIGLEIKKQLELIDEEPNILVASLGSGSYFYGLIAPFMSAYLKNKLDDVKFLAVESETSSKLTNGKYEYVSMRKRGMPGLLMKAYDCGWDILPQPIMAKGIQTNNTAPIISLLHNLGFIDTVVYPKDEKAIFDAARIFLQTEGILLAPEAAYAVRAAIDEAIESKKMDEKKVIVISVSATTYLDFGEKKRYISSIF